MTIVRTTAATGTTGAIRTLSLRAASTGTPVIGYGNTLEFETESTPGTYVRSGYIENKSTGDNAGVLDEFKMSFGVMSAGVSTERMVLDNLGNLQVDGDLTVTGGDITLTGSTSGSVKLSAGATPAVQTYTLPTAYPSVSNYGLRSTTAGVLSWALTGDVSGPSSSTDNAVARFDLATGKIIQNSGVIIDDSNNITGVLNITASGDIQGDTITANNRIDTDGVLELYSNAFGPSVETQVFYYTATGNSLQTVNSWATISYITGKYTLSMRKGTDYHSMEIMVLHDGTTAYMNTYSEIFTNASLATLTVDISVGNVRLRITPATVGSLEMVIERKLFAAI